MTGELLLEGEQIAMKPNKNETSEKITLELTKEQLTALIDFSGEVEVTMHRVIDKVDCFFTGDIQLTKEKVETIHKARWVLIGALIDYNTQQKPHKKKAGKHE